MNKNDSEGRSMFVKANYDLWVGDSWVPHIAVGVSLGALKWATHKNRSIYGHDLLCDHLYTFLYHFGMIGQRRIKLYAYKDDKNPLPIVSDYIGVAGW